METIILPFVKRKDIPFPCIAKLISDLSELTVLFTAEKTGTVLIGDRDHKVGYYCTIWISIYDRSAWDVLDEITINFKS